MLDNLPIQTDYSRRDYSYSQYERYRNNQYHVHVWKRTNNVIKGK